MNVNELFLFLLVFQVYLGCRRQSLGTNCDKSVIRNDFYLLLTTCHSFFFVLASISGNIRLQKAEPGHKLCWICRDLVWHLSLRNPVYSHLFGQYGPVLPKEVGVYGPVYSHLFGQYGPVSLKQVGVYGPLYWHLT